MAPESDPVQEACKGYTTALEAARARSESEEEFWADGASNKAYSRLVRAALGTSEDLRAGYALFFILGDFATRVWETPSLSAPAETDGLCTEIRAALARIATSAWIAVTALENRFAGFPEVTELDHLTILNLSGSDASNPRHLLDRFQALLVEQFDFPPRPSSPNPTSYYTLDEHYFGKSGGYIPTRPMLLVRLGQASEFDAQVFCDQLLRDSLPLLLLCQLAYDMRDPAGFRILRTNDQLVDAYQIESDSLLGMPAVALALNLRDGEAAFWHRRFPLFERVYGLDYRQEEFVRLWQTISHPLLEARRKGIPPKIGAVLENAVHFVAQGRHQDMDDVALRSVIATEALLNPFKGAEGIAERFRTFGAALVATTLAERVEAYERLRKVYGYRCKLVHRAGYGAEITEADAKFAFEAFLSCLSVIVAWATSRLDSGLACDEASFEEYCLQRVFRSEG